MTPARDLLNLIAPILPSNKGNLTGKERKTMSIQNATPPKVTPAKPIIRPKTGPAATPQVPKQNLNTVSEETIRFRAYQNWEAAGKPAGNSLYFWSEAERELLSGK
jgi:hypothetical protein